jgi:hypothetical protein
VAGRTSAAHVSTEFVDAAKPAAVTQSLVRVGHLSQGMLQGLEQAGFDVTENQHADSTDLVADAPKLELLDRAHIPYTVRIADLAAYDQKTAEVDAKAAAAGPSVLPTGRTDYRFLADYQAELKQIVDNYPGIARAVTIGKSYQGREIQGVEISKDVNATDDGKPVFFLMGLHHAREWPSAETAMEFAWLMAKGYGTDDSLTSLLGKERIVIVPIVNPDGFVASRGESAAQAAVGPIPDPEDSSGFDDTAEPIVAGGSFAYRRKNCDGGLPAAAMDNDAARSLPCYYQYGVDPNRNYGFGWGGPGASSDPTTQSYRGDGQWSEPETQAVHAFSQTHPVTAMITLHTIAALVLRPPGLHTAGQAPDEQMLKDLGDRMAAFTHYTSEYGFELYDTSGTTEDWNYGAAGTLGYTIEQGPVNGVFHGPYQQYVADQWVGKFHGALLGGMHDALLAAANAAADPASHSIITGTGTPGATLEVKKTFTTDSAPICTFAQGFLTAGSAISPLDCVAPGTIPSTSQPDMLDYTMTVPSSGAFTWNITQSTRPFVGFKYDNGQRVSTGKTEAWTLTCKSADGTVLGTRSVTIDRGEQQALGDVCS